MGKKFKYEGCKDRTHQGDNDGFQSPKQIDNYVPCGTYEV